MTSWFGMETLDVYFIIPFGAYQFTNAQKFQNKSSIGISRNRVHFDLEMCRDF